MDVRPLLAAPARIVRDAARATRRVTGLQRQPVTAGTLTELLDLPGVVVTAYAIERQGEDEVLHLFGAHAHDVALCPRCGHASTALHDQEERCVRHLDVWGKRTFVHFPARRFDCPQCHKPFTETLAWLDDKRRQTCAFEQHIYAQCQHTDHAAVATAAALHPDTVQDIFVRLAKRAERRHRRSRVRYLGVDELAVKKGHRDFALVLSDLRRHCVLAVLPERTQEAFRGWLAGLPAEERAGIRVVAMDMWGPYRGVVRAVLPHAAIVADRFHVMQQLNDRVAQVRRALQAKADPATRAALKGTYWLLIRNGADLTPEEAATLQAALAVAPTLRTAYLLKEAFRTICDKVHDRPQAERFLRAWALSAEATGLAPLGKFVQTLRHWWHEFLHYFDEGVTSGVVEGLNRAIRAILRRACGYHVFEHFRLHVLVEHGGLATSTPLM